MLVMLADNNLVGQTVSYVHHPVRYLLSFSHAVNPVRAVGSTVPLINLISALYILFACLHHMLPYLSYFRHFSLIIISFENRPAPFPGQRS